MSEQTPALNFAAFVFSLLHTTAVHLGDAADPNTGQVTPPNFEAAQQMIDILGILEEKTKGNLTGDEERLLAQVLFDLRMRYVERSKSR